MSDMLIYIDRSSDLNLQQQIRQKLVQAIVSGVVAPDQRLPSSRKLAEQLAVSRNTVILAYQQLVEENYLLAKERSGLYVNTAMLAAHGQQLDPATKPWQPFISLSKTKRGQLSNRNWPADAFPFYSNQFDTSLYPNKEWREASRLALTIPEIHSWASQEVDRDDGRLLEQIVSKILPRRGIHATSGHLMVTAGLQQAHYLISQCLIEAGQVVAVEEPGNPVFYKLAQQRQAKILHQPVDADGMQVNTRLKPAGLIYTSPSHQLPTNTTMTMARRLELLQLAREQDSLIVEDDSLQEHSFLGSPHPAITSMDDWQRVIYVASLGHILGDGLQLAFIAAPEAIIERLKGLRDDMGSGAAKNNQRTMAFFLSLGHYESYIYKLDEQLKERWLSLRDALNYFLHSVAEIVPSNGGTALWFKLKAKIDGQQLIAQARQHGVYLEPIGVYYQALPEPSNVFRLGISSIPANRIKAGIKKLAALIRELEQQRQQTFTPLSSEQLLSMLPGAVISSHTVYGESYTIEILSDGRLKGFCEQDTEDCDTGEWRIEEGQFVRRWQHWVYGQEAHYFVAIKDNQIFWLNDDLELRDTGVVQKERC